MAAARRDRGDRRRARAARGLHHPLGLQPRRRTGGGRRRRRAGARAGIALAGPRSATPRATLAARRRRRVDGRVVRGWARCALMRVTVTGATGLIGSSLVAALRERGARSHGPHARPSARLASGSAMCRRCAWEPLARRRRSRRCVGRDAVVHLAGEPVAQRWSETAKRAIRDSRVTGTGNLVAGLAALADGSGAPADADQLLRDRLLRRPRRGAARRGRSGGHRLPRAGVRRMGARRRRRRRARAARRAGAHGRGARPRRRRAREDAAAVPARASADRSPAVASTSPGSTRRTSSG